MKILETYGRDDIAIVYIAETDRGCRIEFVESLEPPYTRDEKWVIIVSSLDGCPVGCEMCDAGGDYHGKLTPDEIISQIDYLVKKRYPNLKIPSKKFKIQFARMGEPAFNISVLDALKKLPFLYDAAGLIPAVSTIAPAGHDHFFEQLLVIKKELYPKNFQLQFSIHSTDQKVRDRIMPVKKWGLEKISEYGRRFFDHGGRKITLNFVLADGYVINPYLIKEIFPQEAFFIKMTPLNPTFQAASHGLKSALTLAELSGEKAPAILKQFERAGFEVLLSVGELEENLIGSNCGQYLKRMISHHDCREGRLLHSISLWPPERIQ